MPRPWNLTSASVAIFFDYFGYVGPPDPSKWTKYNNPTVDGNELTLHYSTSDEVYSIPTFLYKTLEVMAELLVGEGPNAIGFANYPWTTNYIVAARQTPGNDIWFETNDGTGSEVSIISGIDGTSKTYKIVWTPTAIDLYIDSVLKAHHTLKIPSIPLSVSVINWGVSVDTIIDSVEVY